VGEGIRQWKRRVDWQVKDMVEKVFQNISLPKYLEPLIVPESHPSNPEAIDKLCRLAFTMSKMEGEILDLDQMTAHHFADGIYLRQWNQVKGNLAISKTHAKENFLVLLMGECLISTGEETVHLVAPYITKTMPGVKRAVYALTDITIVTFHPNPDNGRDIKALEERLCFEDPSWESVKTALVDTVSGDTPI